MAGSTEGAWMASQIRHIFQANQAAHGADDVTALLFESQVNSLSICSPQADTLSLGFEPGSISFIFQSSTIRAYVIKFY